MAEYKKIFKSTEEVNTILPDVARDMVTVREHYMGAQKDWQSLLKHSGANGSSPKDITDNSDYVVFDKHLKNILELGGLIKDVARGHIEFPYIHKGRLIMLSWQPSDGLQIQFWHELHQAYDDRKEIKF